jgi:carbamate kinase
MRIVVALGGNALLRRGEPPTAAAQRANLQQAAAALAETARRHAVVITHGNGQQVGFLALQGERGRLKSPYPLDVLGAESEGMIGYLIEEELSRRNCSTPCWDPDTRDMARGGAGTPDIV